MSARNLLNVLQNASSQLVKFLEGSTDVTFIVGEERIEFNENRVFLAAQSPVFKAMLYGQMQESQPNADIPLEDVKPAAFKFMVGFCHCTLTHKLTADNIFDVMQIADKYQMHRLSKLCDVSFPGTLNCDNFCSVLNKVIELKLDKYKQECVRQISSCLKKDNFCDILDYVVRRNITECVEKCKLKIKSLGSCAKSTKSIIESESFKKMCVKAMKIFLRSSDWMVKEEDLWNAVLEWKEYQISIYSEVEPPAKKRKLNCNKNVSGGINEIGFKFMTEICPLIRFCLMDPIFFVTNIKESGYLIVNEMNEILTYYVCKDADDPALKRKYGALVVPRATPPTRRLHESLRMLFEEGRNSARRETRLHRLHS